MKVHGTSRDTRHNSSPLLLSLMLLPHGPSESIAVQQKHEKWQELSVRRPNSFLLGSQETIIWLLRLTMLCTNKISHVQIPPFLRGFP